MVQKDIKILGQLDTYVTPIGAVIESFVAKVKKNKLQSIQEVKADIPSVDTKELEQSIAYLENQRSKLQRAVELRKQQAYISAQLAILEAQRLAEQDDEESVLLLM